MFKVSYVLEGPIPNLKKEDMPTSLDPIEIIVGDPEGDGEESQFIKTQNHLDDAIKELQNYQTEVVPAIRRVEGFIMNEDGSLYGVAVRKITTNIVLQNMANSLNIPMEEFIAGIIHEMAIVFVYSAYLSNDVSAINSFKTEEEFEKYWRKENSIFYKKPNGVTDEEYKDALEDANVAIADLTQTSLLRYLSNLSKKFGYKEFVGAGPFDALNDIIVLEEDE